MSSRTSRQSYILNRLRRSRSVVTALSLVSLALTSLNPARAATFNWTRGGGNNNWNNASNWSPSGSPASVAGDIVDLSTIDWTAAQTLNLNNGTTTANRTVGTIIFGDLTGNTNWTLAPNGGTGSTPKLILAGAAGTAGTIQVNGGTATINAVVDGSAGIIKTGAGTVAFTNAGNLFSGGIALNAGGLTFNTGTLNNNLITTGGNTTLTWNAHTDDYSSKIKLGDGFALTLGLSTNSADTTTFASALQIGPLGTGSIIKANASTLIITAAQTYTGGTTLNNGRTVLSGGDNRLSTSGPVVVGSGSNITTLQLGDASAKSDQTVSRITVGGGTAANYAVVGGNAANSTLTINGTLASVAPRLGGTGTNENNLSLVKTGSGTLSLAQANSFTGDVTIQGGAVTVTNGGALGAGNKTVTILGTVNAPGLKLNDTVGFGLGSNLSFITGNDNATTPAIENVAGTNVISGSIALASGGFGTGGTRIRSTAGSLTLDGAIAPQTSTAGTVTLSLDGASNGTVNGLIANNGALVLGVTKAGAGTWSLTTANSYGGPTQVTAGRLNVTTAQTGGGAITVADTASLGVTVAGAGQTLNTSALTLGTAGSTSLFLNLGSAGNPTAPVIAAPSFSTATAGTSALNISATGLSVGQFPLISYTGSIGGGGYAGLVLGTLPARVIASLVNNTSSVDLNVTAFDLPKWTGENSSVWDFDPDGTGATGTQNWREVSSGNLTRYLQGTGGTDSVRFDDTASVPTNVTLGGTLTPASITVNTSANAFTFSGAGKISGSTTLTKQGSTTLTLANTGTNDFTGLATISGGALQIGDGATAAAGQLGTGDVINNGSLIFNRPDDLSSANVISGSGSITKQGAGVLTLSGNNVGFTGGITVGAGTLKVGSVNALGSSAGSTTVNAGATLEFTGIALAAEPVTINGGTVSSVSGTSSLGGAVTLSSGGTVNVTAGTTTLSGAINGAGDLVKTGAGALVLSGSSSFAGGLNITAGNATLSGTHSFSGGLSVNTLGGTVTLSANQSYTGGTTITQGTLQLGAAANATTGNVGTGDITLNPGTGQTASLLVQRGNASSSPFVIANNITSSGAGTNAVTIGANGTSALNGFVTFSGNNTFTGNVTIAGGALTITNSNALGAGPKTINIQSNARPALILDGSGGNLSLASNLSYNLSSDGTILTTFAQNAGGIINAAGNNTINGNIALTNGGGGNGKVVVNAGTLTLAGTIDATGATNAKNFLLGGAGTGTVSGVIADWFDTTASANRVVSLIKETTGSWTLSGDNTFTGTVTVSDGTLKIGTITTGGTAQPLGQATTAIVLGTATTNGTLEYNGTTATTLDRPVTVGGVGGGTIKNSSGQLLTLNNTLTKNGRPLTLSSGEFLVSGLIAGTAANSDLIIDNSTVTLTNATNSYNGPTVVQNGGKVIIAGDYLGLVPATPTAGNVKINNGTLNTTADIALNVNRGIAVGPTTGTGSGTIRVDSGTTLTVNGIIADNGTGTGGLNKTGTGTLVVTNANTLTGDVNVNAGTLRVNNASGSATGSGAVTIAPGAVIQGTGAITAAANKVITINGALLIGDPTVNAVADLSITTSGTGSTVVGAGSILSFDIFSGAGAGTLTATDADVLRLFGNLNITSGATIKLNNPNSLTAWAAGDTFQIFDWAGLVARSGSFTLDVSSLSLPGGLGLNTSDLYTGGTFSLIAVPEPGRAALLLLGGLSLALRRRRTVAL